MGLSAASFLAALSLSAFPLPPPLETGHLLGRGLPSGTPPAPLQDQLYALGWSRSNHFAVLEHRPALGEARLRVFDLVTDDVVSETVWTDWGEGDKDAWWAGHEREADAIFAKFSLHPTTWQLGVFPLILDNEYYTLALRTFRSARDPSWIERWEVFIHSTGRGIKSVSERSGYWRWASLLGFLPSPYENRVALVLLVQPSGWKEKDEPPRFVVTGLSLKAGFSKP